MLLSHRQTTRLYRPRKRVGALANFSVFRCDFVPRAFFLFRLWGNHVCSPDFWDHSETRFLLSGTPPVLYLVFFFSF